MHLPGVIFDEQLHPVGIMAVSTEEAWRGMEQVLLWFLSVKTSLSERPVISPLSLVPHAFRDLEQLQHGGSAS